MQRVSLPNLHTKRLLLRPITLDDVADVFEYAKDPQVGPNAGWKPHEDIEETFEFVRYAIKKRDYGQPGIYAIVHKEHNKVIGTIEVHTYRVFKGEIGFVLNPNYWNQGIITEASKALIIYAFEILCLKRLTYGYFPFNERSKAVCKKLGFKEEGYMRNKFMNYANEVLDEVVSSLTDDDYYNGYLDWVKDFKKDLFID